MLGGGGRIQDFYRPKTLISAFFKTKYPILKRNQISFIREFCTEIAHVLGCGNIVADALSRQFDDPAVAMANTIEHRLADVDLDQLAADQCSEDIDEFTDTSLSITQVNFPGIRESLWCDVVVV